MNEPEQNEVITGDDAGKVEATTEDTNLLNKPIGTIEKPSIKPAIVKIASVIIKTKKSDGTDMKVPAASVLVIHPDKKDEPIAISKITYLDGKTLKTAGLWVQLDDNKEIQKSSAIDRLLTYLKKATLKEIEGMTIDTVQESDDSKYLSLKAY